MVNIKLVLNLFDCHYSLDQIEKITGYKRHSIYYIVSGFRYVKGQYS